MHDDSVLNSLFNTLQSVTCQSDNLYYTYLQSKILEQSDGCLSSRSDTVIEISNLQQQRKQLTRLKTPWCQRGIKGSVWSQNNLVNKSIAFSSHCLLSREKKKSNHIFIILRASYEREFPYYILQHFPCILSDPKNPREFSAIESTQTQT